MIGVWSWNPTTRLTPRRPLKPPSDRPPDVVVEEGEDLLRAPRVPVEVRPAPQDGVESLELISQREAGRRLPEELLDLLSETLATFLRDEARAHRSAMTGVTTDEDVVPEEAHRLRDGCHERLRHLESNMQTKRNPGHPRVPGVPRVQSSACHEVLLRFDQRSPGMPLVRSPQERAGSLFLAKVLESAS